jgi:NDP-hexose-3-ketoreductase
MNKKLKFGIIGCSSISERSTIPAIKKSDFAELKMIGSRSETKSKEFAKKFECAKFGTYDDVLADNDLDVVYISTPIGTHEELSIKAAKAGKHVICEKSSTVSFQSAKKIVDNCVDNKVRILEGFMFRFHPQHKKVKDLINNGSIGKSFLFNGNFGFPEFPRNNIRYDLKLGGGFLNDSGCYPICASRIIFEKEPREIMCNLSIDPETGVDVRGHSYMVFDNEKTASVSFANGNFYQANYQVWGSKGIIELERAYSVPPDFSTTVNIHSSQQNNWSSRQKDVFEISPTNHFLTMVDIFCKEIMNIESATYNFEDDLLNQAKVMEAHRLSNKENRFVHLSEITM